MKFLLGKGSQKQEQYTFKIHMNSGESYIFTCDKTTEEPHAKLLFAILSSKCNSDTNYMLGIDVHNTKLVAEIENLMSIVLCDERLAEIQSDLQFYINDCKLDNLPCEHSEYELQLFDKFKIRTESGIIPYPYTYNNLFCYVLNIFIDDCNISAVEEFDLIYTDSNGMEYMVLGIDY